MKYRENVCHFLPASGGREMAAVNMVYEVSPRNIEEFTIRSSYILFTVTKGSGTLSTLRREYNLSEGDVFFVVPDMLFKIRSEEGWSLSYITFVGIGVKGYLSRIGVSEETPVFKARHRIKEEFLSAVLRISGKKESGVFVAESALLSAFAHLLPDGGREKYEDSKKSHIDRAVKMIVENTGDEKLSLSFAAKALALNPNYLSRIFKEITGRGFSQYLLTVRIQRACSIIENGITSVKNIAFLSGFSDPLYFSKAFKSKMGVSPKLYIERIAAAKKVTSLDLKDWAKNFYVE